MKNSQNLGNQFDELLGDINKETRSDMIQIDIRTIDVNWEENVRQIYSNIEALSESIKEHGLKEPLKVSRIKGTDRVLLVDGHRRYKAIMSLLEQGVPVTRVKAILVNNSPEVRLSEMIITGVQKQPLHPVEQAEAFLRLQQYGWDVKKIASMLSEDGKNRMNLVYRYLKLANAPETIKQRCLKGEISHDTVIKIIEDTGADYEKVVETVEDAVAANTIVTETGEKVVKKVKTRQVEAIVKPKKSGFMEKIRLASDEFFNEEGENEILEEFIKLDNTEASVEDIKAFFRSLKKS